MKAKTLRTKDTKEFIHLYLFGSNPESYSCEIPQILSITADINDIKKINPEINFDDYELIEIDIVDSGEIGADIRNKLSPLKNLLAIIKKRDECDNDELFNKLTELMKKEMNQCEISIDYLAKLL
jgi:hypothetical protein